MKFWIKSLLEDKIIPKFISMAPYYCDKSVKGILCGRLPSQKSIRVLFLSVRNGELLRTALDLQPKSIMSFFGGTLAATSLNSDSEPKITMYRGWYTHELQTLNVGKNKKNRKLTNIHFSKSFKDREEVERWVIEDIAKGGLDSTIPKTQPVQISEKVHEHFEGHEKMYEKMLSRNERCSINGEIVLYDFLYGGVTVW